MLLINKEIKFKIYIKKLNLKYIEEKLIINKENKEIKFERYWRKLMLVINKKINFKIYQSRKLNL